DVPTDTSPTSLSLPALHPGLYRSLDSSGALWNRFQKGREPHSPAPWQPRPGLPSRPGGPMKRATIAALACVASLAFALPTLAQTRVDYIWARATDGPITMDGVLNEPAWALADSMVIKYGQDSGIPGSGWFNEAGILPQDPTNATVKFLHVRHL